MFCGSCLHDNALTVALKKAGWNIQLVPTYTPIRTDERDASTDLVFFGGINVYLQQKIPLVRHLPSFLDRFLDAPWLLRRVTTDTSQANSKLLGPLAVSMLSGDTGNQAKEVRRLVKWVGLQNPGVVVFSNILVAACARNIKESLATPVLVTLQGDDVFLDSLPDRYREACIRKIAELAPFVDAFIVHSEFYRDYISVYLGLPLEKFRITKLGIETSDFETLLADKGPANSCPPPTIGYLARIAPEKGLHQLVAAFIKLKQNPAFQSVQLKIAGWLGAGNQAYAETQWAALRDAGLEHDFEYLGTIEREEKLRFLSSLSVLSVPTEFQEPKGLYALEALAAGVPVVLPAHGTFPELIAASQAGCLFKPGDTDELADQIQQLLADPGLARSLGQAGRQYVLTSRNADTVAQEMGQIIEAYLRRWD